MNILVTGHKGFIGKNLFKFLKKKKINVTGYDYKTNKSFPKIKKYNWVIHLGAISSTTEMNFNKVMKQNFYFSKRLLLECIKHNVNMQYASSASVYDKKYGFKENSKSRPRSPYSISKAMFDKYVGEIEHKIIIQGFRYFNVFGSNENNKKSQASPVYKFIKQAKTKKNIKIFYNSNKYKRDFVYVEDVCEVHHKMLSKKNSGLFNVGRGESISFEKIAKEIAKKFSCNVNYINMPPNIKKHYQKYTKANNSKLIKIVSIKWTDPLSYIRKLKRIY